MAGFSRIYCVGGQGGFIGTDGINPLLLEILEGHSDRMWFEAVYVDTSLRPLGDLRVVVPAGPDDPNAMLDCCLAFFPAAFEACPSLSRVRIQLGSRERLDFDADPDGVPESWLMLRSEAAPIFAGLNLWQADLVKMELAAGE